MEMVHAYMKQPNCIVSIPCHTVFVRNVALVFAVLAHAVSFKLARKCVALIRLHPFIDMQSFFVVVTL